MKYILAPLLFCFLSCAAAAASPPEMNKKVVKEFFVLAFNHHKPRAALQKYAAESFSHHVPHLLPGKKGFAEYYEEMQSSRPTAYVELKRLVAEGDLVVAHYHYRIDRLDRGEAVADIFRFSNGKIVEMWSARQAVPSESANQNTVF